MRSGHALKRPISDTIAPLGQNQAAIDSIPTSALAGQLHKALLQHVEPKVNPVVVGEIETMTDLCIMYFELSSATLVQSSKADTRSSSASSSISKRSGTRPVTSFHLTNHHLYSPESPSRRVVIAVYDTAGTELLGRRLRPTPTLEERGSITIHSGRPTRDHPGTPRDPSYSQSGP